MAESTEKVTSTDKGTGKTVERREVTKKGGGLRWILYAAVVIIVILAAAYLTIGVVISEAPPAASYPYTTTYQVFFPASQVVTIGNSEIIAIPTTGDQVTLSINKQPSVMSVGETKTIQEQRAVISVLSVKVMDFDFRVDATYQGRTGDTPQFYLAFRTSKQVPSFLIERLLPASVQARPV